MPAAAFLLPPAKENEMSELELLKGRINRMTYYELLKRWRFASTGDPLFQGEIGEYYAKKMKEKREQITADEHVNTSKAIGWNK